MQQLVAQFLFYYFTVFAKDASSAAISGFFSLNSISNCNSQSINILIRTFAIYAETHTAVIHGDDVFKIGDRIKVSRQSGFHNRPNRHGNLSNIIGTVIASVGWSL